MQKPDIEPDQTTEQHPFWWQLNMTSMRYSCSDDLSRICGIDTHNVSHEDFLMLISPYQKNKIVERMQAFIESSVFDEKFELLTKFGYRWVNSTIIAAHAGQMGEYILSGQIEFMTQGETIIAQYAEDKARMNDLMNIYVSFSKTMTELLDPSLSSQSIIDKILNSLLDEFKSERAYIFEYDRATNIHNCVHEVVTPGTESTKESMQQKSTDGAPWWTHMLFEERNPIIYNNIHDLPIEAYNEYKLFTEQKVKSIMVMPLINKEGANGCLGIETVSQQHAWSDIDKLWFESLANIISLCIELKRSEECAQKEQLHYKQLYENMPISCMRIKLIYDESGDPTDYIYLDVNSEARKMFPTDQDEIIGKRASELGVPIPAEEIQFVKEIVETNDIRRVNGVCINDHYLDYILYSVNPGELIAIIQDNTDSLKAKNKVREFEILFNSIAEFSEVGLSQWNPCQNTLFGTDQWYNNICQPDHHGSDIKAACSSVVSEDRESLYTNFDQMVGGQIKEFRSEIRIQCGKRIKWLRTNYKVVEYQPEKNNIEVIGINIDITELKNTEHKLIEAKQKAEESDKLKSAFLANMSHEIRTPLNAITGFSDLLIATESTEEKEQYINTIRQNNDLLLKLISDILDLSQIESGIVDINIEQINAHDVCTEVIFAQSVKANNHVKLIFENHNQGDCMVWADSNRLAQILINLTNNAMKFTDKGVISIGYQVEQGEVIFHVKDSGLGISSEQQNTIFDRFVKINSFIPGTGLGLAICKNLVEKMSGRIWVESEIGKGSQFYFTLPHEPATSSTQTVRENNSEKIIENSNIDTTQNSIADKKLILVAEDTDSNYLLVSMILRKEYKLIRAHDGVEAVALYQKHKPALILMDIKMPNMDGLEATKKIRKIAPAIPIFALTAFAYNNDRLEAVAAGCSEFLTKPINHIELKETIAKYI